MSAGSCLHRSWASGLRSRGRRRGSFCGLRLCSSCLRFLVFFFRGLLRRKITEMLAHEFGMTQVNGTRVRLFLFDADLREVINQDLRLDFELPCQLVDSNLIRI
jgi:hypothetical protein